jgi:hypothetical protein
VITVVVVASRRVSTLLSDKSRTAIRGNHTWQMSLAVIALVTVARG